MGEPPQTDISRKGCNCFVSGYGRERDEFIIRKERVKCKIENGKNDAISTRLSQSLSIGMAWQLPDKKNYYFFVMCGIRS
jgi:hypothetical protein